MLTKRGERGKQRERERESGREREREGEWSESGEQGLTKNKCVLERDRTKEGESVCVRERKSVRKESN